MSKGVLHALDACYLEDEEAMAWAEHALSLPPDQAWSALIDRSQEDAWWLIQRITPQLCEELAEPWRRFALRAAAWAMLTVDATHTTRLIEVADAEKFDRHTAAETAWTAVVETSCTTAAETSWTAAGAAAGAATKAAAEAARAAAGAAKTAAGVARAAARTADRAAAWWTTSRATVETSWAAKTASWAAAEAARTADRAATEVAARQQLREATPRVVEAWERWLKEGE